MNTFLKRIESVYKLYITGMTGALKTTPTAAFYTLLHLLPVDLSANKIVSKTAGRLNAGAGPTDRVVYQSILTRRIGYIIPVPSRMFE